MGGQEKKRVFSDFGLHPLVHREFPKAESGNFFQRYTVLAMWRVINIPKDFLSLFSLWDLL